MRYGTEKSARSWRFTITLPVEACCPGCAELLQSCVVEFRDGWAWCPVCVIMGLHAEPWIPAVLESSSMQQCSWVCNGLRFYTPHNVGREVKTAYMHGQERGVPMALSVVPLNPDDVYVVTPSGEHRLADLDVTALQETEDTLKRINGRPPYATAKTVNVDDAE